MPKGADPTQTGSLVKPFPGKVRSITGLIFIGQKGWFNCADSSRVAREEERGQV